MKTTQARRWRAAGLKHLPLALAALVMLYPLLWMVSGSLKTPDSVLTDMGLVPQHWDFDNYRRGWHGLAVPFSAFFANSLLIAALAVAGNLFACSLSAFAFARLRFPFRRALFALMLGTLMLPYHVTLIPQYVLFLHLGWVNTVLPLVVPKFLAGDAFFIFLMVQFFRGLPRELDEAAMLDGCGPFRIYWRIVLPLSLPVLATTAIFSFIWSWDDFFAPLIYLSDQQRYTVPLALRSFVDSAGVSDWGPLFAMSTLSVAPVFLLFLFFQRFLIQGIAMTGLK